MRLYNENDVSREAEVPLRLIVYKYCKDRILIRSVITYTCPTWELVADIYLSKLQHMQNKALHTTGNFPRCTLVCDLHTAFNLPYVYNYITKFCRHQAEIIQNYENEHVCSIGTR
jgi:hypothetical protein